MRSLIPIMAAGPVWWNFWQTNAWVWPTLSAISHAVPSHSMLDMFVDWHDYKLDGYIYLELLSYLLLVSVMSPFTFIESWPFYILLVSVIHISHFSFISHFYNNLFIYVFLFNFLFYFIILHYIRHQFHSKIFHRHYSNYVKLN